MTTDGAQFGELAPKDNQGQLNLDFQNLGAQSEGLDTGEVNRVATLDDYRIGQQIMFWLGVNVRVFGEDPDDNWLTSLRLKPWWLRPHFEYRAPGNPEFTTLDRSTFGQGPNNSQRNNRFCWVPSVKRLDQTPFGVAPPPVSPARHSDSYFLDDVWTFDSFRDPTDAAWQAQFSADQLTFGGGSPTRWVVFTYPAMGYALGFTWSGTFHQPPGGGVPRPSPFISLTWSVGNLAVG